MRIVFAASELFPLAWTGGLGDVLEGLPAALAARGHDVSVFLPCYRGLRENPELEVRSTGVEITVQVRDKRVVAEILECTAPNGVQLFLIRRDEYFDRSALYGTEGRAYEDNAERYIFFCKAVVEVMRRISPPPEIIHVHDWQTALIPVLIKERRLPFRSVLTIHNLAYQGNFWAPDFGLTNLPGSYFTAGGVEFYGQLNLLKGGMLYADRVTTVSQRYAHEIQTPEFGCGLDAVAREQSHKLSGILNGADYRIWDPATDKQLPQPYSLEKPAGKTVCRDALLKELELEPAPTGPVVAMVTRLAQQKGIDLLIPIIDRMLSHDVRLIILGEGDPAYERDLAIASRRHLGRFAYRQKLDVPLSHLIYGGADLFLIPSHFEPCGLNAMYALKYGSIPVARAVGGLYESLQNDDPTSGIGNAVIFYEDSPEAFWDAINRAFELFADQPRWHELIQRAMACNFSWEGAAGRYEEVYRQALKAPRT
jgi:starch synthase